MRATATAMNVQQLWHHGHHYIVRARKRFLFWFRRRVSLDLILFLLIFFPERDTREPGRPAETHKERHARTMHVHVTTPTATSYMPSLPLLQTLRPARSATKAKKPPTPTSSGCTRPGSHQEKYIARWWDQALVWFTSRASERRSIGSKQDAAAALRLERVAALGEVRVLLVLANRGHASLRTERRRGRARGGGGGLRHGKQIASHVWTPREGSLVCGTTQTRAVDECWIPRTIIGSLSSSRGSSHRGKKLRPVKPKFT